MWLSLVTCVSCYELKSVFSIPRFPCATTQDNIRVQPPQPRRKRYSGKYPKNYDERYKETNGDHETIVKVTAKGGTAAGQHRPIMLQECMHYLGVPGFYQSADTSIHPDSLHSLQRSQKDQYVYIDCTLGFGGHSKAILTSIAPEGGVLYAIDQDGVELAKTETRLQPLLNELQQNNRNKNRFLYTKQENFGNLLNYANEMGITGTVSAILCDLGYSSMQIDNPSRGFSYKHDGPLDMRMRTSVESVCSADGTVRTQSTQKTATSTSDNTDSAALAAQPDSNSGMTAYDYLRQVKSVSALASVLHDNSDVEGALAIALALLGKDGRGDGIPCTTLQFADRVRRAVNARHLQNNKPVSLAANDHMSGKNSLGLTRKGADASVDSLIAKCMQAIRIEVNAEFLMLERLLTQAPQILAPRGRIVFLTFHSGEDRRVKKAFKEGVKSGIYSHWGRDVVVASKEERFSNPRSKCAKLRWAIKA